MCRLRNIAMCDYQESVTTRQTDARQSDPYVLQATQIHRTVVPSIRLKFSDREEVFAKWAIFSFFQ